VNLVVCSNRREQRRVITRKHFMETTYTTTRRQFIGAAAVFAAGSGLAACGSEDEPKTGSAKSETPKLNAGHLVGGCMAPLFLADATGLFEDEGLSVKLNFFGNSGDNIASLVAGATDVIHNPFSNTLFNKEKGQDLVIVAGSGKGGLELVARAGVGVTSLDDLRAKKGTGLRIGTLRVNTLELTGFHLLKSEGLTYQDFEMVFFNDLLALGQALINKDVDVSTVVQPYAALVVKEAKGIYIGNNETAWGKNAPDCVITLKRTLVDREPDTVKRYLRAVLKANDKIEEDFETSFKALSAGKYFKVTGKTLADGLKRQPPQVRLDDQAITAMDKGVEDMRALGYLKRTKSSDVLSLDLLESVA